MKASPLIMDASKADGASFSNQDRVMIIVFQLWAFSSLYQMEILINVNLSES